MTVEIVLSDASMRWCDRFAATISNTLTNPDRTMSADEQYASKLAELAVAQYLKMEPATAALLMQSMADHDVLTPRGLKGDIKSSDLEHGKLLYWPVKKNGEFDRRVFDFLGFCNTFRAPIIEFRGWVFKQEFRLFKRTAGDSDKLYNGTWFWPEDRPMRDPATLFTWGNGLRAPMD